MFPTVPFSCLTITWLPKSGNPHCCITAIQVPSALPLMSFVAKCADQNKTVHCDLKSLSSLPVWDNSVVFLWLSWSYHFWRSQISYFVKCPSIWGVWCFLLKRSRPCIIDMIHRHDGVSASSSIRGAEFHFVPLLTVVTGIMLLSTRHFHFEMTLFLSVINTCLWGGT